MSGMSILKMAWTACRRWYDDNTFTYGAALHMTDPGLTGAALGRLHDMYLDYVRGAGTRTADECVRLHINTPKGL